MDDRAESHATTSGSPPGMPRWLKVALIVVAVLVGLFLVLHVSGIIGKAGPGLHSGSPQTDLAAERTFLGIRA